MQKIESCLVYFINNAKGSANSQGPGGRTLLAWAVERGSLDAVDYLIRCRGIDVDAIDSRGRTAMAWAAMRGDYDISLHVANGLCMYVKDRNGRTPLSFAAEKGHITILLSLIANIKWWRENANDTNALQDKHWTYEDNKGHTPLWWAVVNDHQETAKTLAANDDGITLHTLIEEEYYIPMGSHFFIESCNYCTQRLAKMHQHMPVYGMKASQHREATPLWRDCRLQTYFTAKGRIDYFIVEDPSLSLSSSSSGEVSALGLLTPPSQEEGKLFNRLKADLAQASCNLEEQAGIVQDEGGSQADRVPWLVHTGFPARMRGLRDAEIQSSYSLPPKKLLDLGGDGGGEGEDDSDLIRILVAAEAVLRDAYKLCSDKSLERKMTQQRAKRLNEFRDAGGSSNSKPGGFRSFKNESSLTSYFRRMKQLLVYYYRVAFRKDGHFTREKADQVLPGDVVEPTSQQQQAMKEIVSTLREQDEKGEEESADEEDKDERDVELKHAIRNFYMALICQAVGSLAAGRIGVSKVHSLLYDELLFGAKDIAPIEAWRLYDDLDLDDYGGSWLTDGMNAEILSGTQHANTG
ncbi:hypothetical protein AUP68_08550 [Ilyonectria robusta]